MMKRTLCRDGIECTRLKVIWSRDTRYERNSEATPEQSVLAPVNFLP